MHGGSGRYMVAIVSSRSSNLFVFKCYVIYERLVFVTHSALKFGL